MLAKCLGITAAAVCLAKEFKKKKEDPKKKEKRSGRENEPPAQGKRFGRENEPPAPDNGSGRENEPPDQKKGPKDPGRENEPPSTIFQPSLNGYRAPGPRRDSIACNGQLRLAAMRAPRLQEGPPWTWRSFSLPPAGRDRWGRLQDGWWVRHRVKPRKRPFHPLHRMTPFDGSRTESRRTVVLWCHGKRHIRTDDWREGAECPMPNEDTWVGYTFFKDLTAPGTGETMETLTSQGSSSTPPQVSGYFFILTSSS